MGDEFMTIGEKIKQLRLARGLDMVMLGNASGLPKQKIWQLEHGYCEYPAIPTLIKIAKGLGCTVVDIISEPLGIESSKFKSTDYPCENADKCPFFKKKE